MSDTGVIEIDGEKALDLLRQAVEKRGGDTVITECFYERGGQPQCLVGEALFIAGVPVEKLRAMDDHQPLLNDSPPISRFAGNLGEYYGFRLTAGAVNAFLTAQQSQDGRETWTSALLDAEIVSGYEPLTDAEIAMLENAPVHAG